MANFVQEPLFRAISEVAGRMPVYVIGGYVRDCLLGRPSKDVDIVVLGDGLDFARMVAQKLGQTSEAKFYGQFGTAMIRWGDYVVEFVGARKESYKLYSRKPDVRPGTLMDDLRRRDFTINALGISLSQNNYGLLLDQFGGIDDLRKGIIRTPLDPDITFSDDPLRMMRAIRFASQLNFSIENNALEAIQRNRNRLRIVSPERITDELNKIILSPKPSVGFKLLFKTGLLHVFFPQFAALQGVETVNGKSHKDNFYHTLEVLDNLAGATDDLWLRWAAVLHDIAKPATKKFDNELGWTFHGHEFKGAKMVPHIFKAFRLPLGDPMKFVQKMVLLHLRPIVLAQETVTDSAVRRLLFDAGDDIDKLMLLCQADVTTKNEYKIRKYRENFELVKQKLIEIEAKDKVRNWQPPISGEIIMKTFGLGPGKEIGLIKNAIREAILDGIISNTFDDAARLMKEEAARLGLKVLNEPEPEAVKNNGPVPMVNQENNQ
ncbi:MAG TPA: HD domain-containing protein [Bacteroidales bacterium]|nr:HD domain-containing protein [Bacteroidales bacterium]